MKLYNADCMEILKTIPDNSIDLVVIDPPYEKSCDGNVVGGGAFGTNHRQYHEQIDSKKLFDGIQNDVLEELKRVMKKVNIYMV